MFERQEEMVSDILKIVSVKSFTEDREGIRKCQKKYQEIAERMGFTSYYKADGKVLIVEPQNSDGEPEIGMVVHLDTVPFDETEWSHNPLGQIDGERIYGRGVVDDKAAAVMALYAAKEIEGKFSKSWQIIVGSDEEGSWDDMETFMNESPSLPKFLFTIDGDGIQHGCRGYMDLRLVFKREEKSYDKLLELKVLNPVNNMVPAKAFANVDGHVYYETGKAVHSSIPQEGKNALEELVQRISKFDEVRREYSGFFELMDRIRNESVEKSIGIPDIEETCKDDCRTTVVPVDCEMIEQDDLVLVLNIRFCSHFSINRVREMLEYISQSYGCSCYIEDLKLPGYIDPSTKYIQGMLECYKKVLKKETKSGVALGTGYNAALPNCAIFGPRFDVAHDEEDFCHMVDESRKISDLVNFTEMLIMYLEMML